MKKNTNWKFARIMHTKFLMYLFASAITLYSCSKKDNQSPSNDLESIDIVPVKQWIGAQKTVALTENKLWFDTMATNLDYNSISEANIDANKIMILIPFKKIPVWKNSFKNIDYMSENISTYLAVIKKFGRILSGSILQLGNNTPNTSPNIIFSIMDPQKGPPKDFTGELTNFSLAKKFYSQYKYKVGSLKSASVCKSKNDIKNGKTTRIINDQTTLSAPPGCTDWYLETTYYDAAGEIIDITDDFLFETCEGEGGGGDGDNPGANCCPEEAHDFDTEVTDANFRNIIWGQGVAAINATTNHRDLYFQIFEGSSGWYLKDFATGIIVRSVNNGTYTPWIWQSLTHTSITMEGNPLPGTTVSVTNVTGTSTITPGGTSASYSLAFSVTFSFSCTCSGSAPIRAPVKKSYTMTKTGLDPNPQLD